MGSEAIRRVSENMQVLGSILSVHLAIYAPPPPHTHTNPLFSIYTHSFYLTVFLSNKLGMDQTQVMLCVILIKEDSKNNGLLVSHSTITVIQSGHILQLF